MIDLEAIKERVGLRAHHEAMDADREQWYLEGMRDDDFDENAAEDYGSAKADIDALLAEVERLRKQVHGVNVNGLFVESPFDFRSEEG